MAMMILIDRTAPHRDAEMQRWGKGSRKEKAAFFTPEEKPRKGKARVKNASIAMIF